MIAKVVEVKAMVMLSQNASKLQEFCDQYFSILSTAFMRVYTQRTDVTFANEVVFQQSVVEMCKILVKLIEIDTAMNTAAQEQCGDVLISTAQIYIDPTSDENQDKRYPIPKGLWPGYLGFEQKFDPLVEKEGNYEGTLNRKSIVQMTKLSIFVQDQLRKIISVYPITHQLSQSFECLKMRSTIINTVKQLRFNCSPFVPEFLRQLLIRITDEPFEIKHATV